MAELVEADENFRSRDQSCSLDCLLEQGDLFARTGRLDLSFRAFSDAFRLGVVPTERISSLVEACLEFQRTKLCKERKEEPPHSNISNDNELFLCLLCNSVFMRPVTLACGHTFCEVCLSEEKSFNGFVKCGRCGRVEAENTLLSVNVLVMNALQKWLPREHQRQGQKLQGLHHLMSHDIKSAIDCFTRVLSTSANDLNCLCWRSDAFLRLGKLDLALRDIDQACKLRPGLARTFYRKAVILANLAKVEGLLSTKHEESVLALLRCYTLAPQSHRYRQEFTESLHQLLSPKFTNLNRTLSVLKHNQSGGNELPNESLLRHFASSSGKAHSVKNDMQLNSALGGGVKKKTETKTSPLAYSESVESSGSELNDGIKSILANGHLQAKCNEGSLAKEVLQVREVEDFECRLCYSLLFQPITTPCGHTFCRECLERSLDHRAECPCCRTELDQYLQGNLKMEVTQALEKMLVKYFPGDYKERLNKFHEKMNALSSVVDEQTPQVPIFVCTLALPKVQCGLHIFEPRYRLMLRQCLESGSRQFGMCLGSEDPEKSFADYGTMLNVQTVNFLPDGRSIVHTVGGRRFHVISRGMVDGYHTAIVEWIQDERVDDVEEMKQLIELNRVGHLTLQSWFSQMAPGQRQCITNAIGPVPTFDENLHLLNDGPDWVWWALQALPLQDKPKLIILSMTSMRERIQSVIRFLQLMLSWQNRSAGASSTSS